MAKKFMAMIAFILLFAAVACSGSSYVVVPKKSSSLSLTGVGDEMDTFALLLSIGEVMETLAK